MSSTIATFYDGLSSQTISPPVESVVFGWGANEDGQLGDNREIFSSAPRVVESLLGSRLCGRTLGRNPLVAGSRNTIALSCDGVVWSCGWNDRGTLGRGEKTNDKSTNAVYSLKNRHVVQVDIGGWHCLAVDNEGKVYAWGGNEYRQCGLDISNRDVMLPTPIVEHLVVRQVACGGMHSLALTTNGQVWTWGEPCGEFALQHDRSPRQIPIQEEVMMIACGAFHNMALDNNGKVFTWGINTYGQLGHGNTRYSTLPKEVDDLEVEFIVDITAGGWHSIALTRNGKVYIWGRGEYGRLGLGKKFECSQLEPHLVPGLEEHFIVQVAAGGSHTLCLTQEGRMFIWGRASFGRLGNGETDQHQYYPQEVHLPGCTSKWKVLAIACGGRHSLCLAIPQLDAILEALSDHGSVGDDEGSEDQEIENQ